MQASAVSARRQSLEGLLAMFIMGGGLWGIGMAGAILMYGKTFLSSENFGYYVLNTLVMMAVALCAFLSDRSFCKKAATC